MHNISQKGKQNHVTYGAKTNKNEKPRKYCFGPIISSEFIPESGKRE